MSIVILEPFEKPRLKALLDHFGAIEDPREPWRVAHPLAEVLFLVVCGTICDCDDYDLIADWGETHLAFLRRYRPYHHGVPGGRWLTILMNRIDPALFSAAFTSWVRETWPDRHDFVAIDGKTSRRSHDRSAGTLSISSRPSRPPPGSCSDKRPLPTRAARPRPSRFFWKGSDKMVV